MEANARQRQLAPSTTQALEGVSFVGLDAFKLPTIESTTTGSSSAGLSDAGSQSGLDVGGLEQQELAKLL